LSKNQDLKDTQINGAKFDHVAIAVKNWSDAWDLFVYTLGGRWRSGGQNLGFAPAQFAFKNEMKVELLMPFEPQYNDFLDRFLSKHGPGPHHLTFKVPDLKKSLEVLEHHQITPTGVNLNNPWWKEAFIYPKQAFGIVIQLAQALGSWFSPPPEGVPKPPDKISSSLLWVGHAVSDIEQAQNFFVNVLGAKKLSEGQMFAGALNFVELSWDSPATLRLLFSKNNQELEGFLKGRPGRLHHLAFSTSSQQVLAKATFDKNIDTYLIKPDNKTNITVVLYPEDNA
jgi:catechol 2,3-dioxygenase-like lactoylglutathione lyase family enzyme